MNTTSKGLDAFRMPDNVRQVGNFAKGGHRSGWPYVVSALKEHQKDTGILLDDFVERTFKPDRHSSSLLNRILPFSDDAPTWREPWVGIFHYPPNFPEWFDPYSNPEAIFSGSRFKKSIRHLRGAIALSEYMAKWLRTKLDVPVTAIKHPTEFPHMKFTWDAFSYNRDKKLVQVGWYLRNYRAIHQVAVPHEFRKLRLAQEKPWIIEAQKRTDQHSPFRDRRDTGFVHIESWMENSEYDRLLCENIMFMEVFDASANNAIVEAIVRETPIVVNRHPAIVEYLGADYPLFYDDIREVRQLMTLSVIRQAHEYLRALDKEDLRIDNFIQRLADFIIICSDNR